MLPLLFILLIAQAGVYETYHCDVDLSQQSAHFSIGMMSELGEFLEIHAPPHISDLSVRINDEPVECSHVERKGETVIKCNTSSFIGESYINAEYDTPYPLLWIGDRLLFSTNFNVSARSMVLRISLPVGFIIPPEREPEYFVNPPPDGIYSDGRRIILLWEERNVSSFAVSVLSEPVGAEIPLIPVAISAAALLTAATVMLVRRRKSPYELLEAEKLIVETLRKAKGRSLTQRELLDLTNLSKAKLSRTLRSLEVRGIIEKKPHGTTNLIRLRE